MEISAFLDRKLARRFKTFDTDGDGFVEREDFELTVNRMGEEFGLAPDNDSYVTTHELLADPRVLLRRESELRRQLGDGQSGRLNAAPASG